MSLGLAIIARDEEQSLPRLLESVEGAFDQVVLLDTGSTDRTVEVFTEWAQANVPEDKPADLPFYKVGHFEWVHDFAAARNAADAMLDTEWRCWADCDDIITNAQVLRGIAASQPEPVQAVVFDYNYAQHPTTGECICTLKRERLVRHLPELKWVGRVHEAQIVTGPAQFVDRSVCEWVHLKALDQHGESGPRNLSILEKWNRDEPNTPRVLAYLGTEFAARGEFDKAIRFFRRYLKHQPAWDEERAQVIRKLSRCLVMKGEVDAAERLSAEVLLRLPTWPDTALTLAEVAFARGEWDKVLHWSDQAQAAGTPQTMLIVNPADYTLQPMRLKAGALGELGQPDAALDMARAALEVDPGDVELRRAAQHFAAVAKRERTAETYCLAAEQLVGHDEQLKALSLLDCVPHFAIDHPKVVGMRSWLRERVSWAFSPEAFAEHYQTGGSKPEDFVPDDKVDELNSFLPRSQFLLTGIREQIGAA